MNGTAIQKFLAMLKLQKILGNICFSEQIFCRKQSLGAPDLFVALQLICALNKQNRQLRRPSLCTVPPTPCPQENRLRGPGMQAMFVVFLYAISVLMSTGKSRRQILHRFLSLQISSISQLRFSFKGKNRSLSKVLLLKKYLFEPFNQLKGVFQKVFWTRQLTPTRLTNKTDSYVCLVRRLCLCFCLC